MKKTLAMLAVASCCTVVACSGTDQQSAKSSSTESHADNSSTAVSVESCGRTIELDHAPEKVAFLNATGVSHMAELNLLDRVVARSGTLDTSLYGDDNQEKLDDLPVLGASETGHGHSMVSTEALLDAHPDILIGYEAGVDREKVEESGIPVYVPDSYCPEKSRNAPPSIVSMRK